MGRKGQYSQEKVITICNAIAAKGSDRDGYKAGGISHQTFYRWFREKVEFRNAVTRARKEAIKNRPDSLTRSAFQVAQGLMETGHIIRRVRRSKQGKTTRNIYKIDSNGKKKLVRIEEEFHEPTIEEMTDEMGVPQWLVQRYLPEPEPDIEQAIAIIKKAGLDVFIANAELYTQFVDENTSQFIETNATFIKTNATEVFNEQSSVKKLPSTNNEKENRLE
jgi:hypothetical protein